MAFFFTPLPHTQSVTFSLTASHHNEPWVRLFFRCGVLVSLSLASATVYPTVHLVIEGGKSPSVAQAEASSSGHWHACKVRYICSMVADGALSSNRAEGTFNQQRREQCRAHRRLRDAAEHLDLARGHRVHPPGGASAPRLVRRPAPSGKLRLCSGGPEQCRTVRATRVPGPRVLVHRLCTMRRARTTSAAATACSR